MEGCGTAGSRAVRRVPPSCGAYPARQLHFSPIIPPPSPQCPHSPSRGLLSGRGQTQHLQRSSDGTLAQPHGPCFSTELVVAPFQQANRASPLPSSIQPLEPLHHHAHSASPGGCKSAKHKGSSPSSTTSSARSAQLASVLRGLQLGSPVVQPEEPGGQASGWADHLPIQTRDGLHASPLHRFLAPSEPSSSKDLGSPFGSASSGSGYHSLASDAATATYHSLRTSDASEGAVSSAFVRSRGTGGSERTTPCIPRRTCSPAVERQHRKDRASSAQSDDGDEDSPGLVWTRGRPTTSRRVIDEDDDADAAAVGIRTRKSIIAVSSASGSPRTPASDAGSEEVESGINRAPTCRPASVCTPGSEGSADLVLGRSTRKPRFCLLEDSDASDDALPGPATNRSRPKARVAQRCSSVGSGAHVEPRGVASATHGPHPVASVDWRRHATQPGEDAELRDPYEFPGDNSGGSGESAVGFLGGKTAGRRPLLEAPGMPM